MAGRLNVGRPVSLPGLGHQGKLAHHHHIAPHIHHAAVHDAFRIIEDPQARRFLYQKVDIRLLVLVTDPQQHQQTGADGRFYASVNGNGRGGNPLNKCTHSIRSWNAQIYEKILQSCHTIISFVT